ncbi:MAG TPA: transcriptional regulator [Sulfurospirillum arcachonense]|nr:transcriptional regulator [Sulfurospirillum arcachonense]HIP45186.1 transcriptional regulator [Sulfurospirillum arcachonense]
MDKKEKNNLKKIILQKEGEILHEIKELEIKTAPIEPDCSLGRLTRLEAMQEKSINESILVKAKIRLKKIAFVLTKIDSEDYGQCSICEEEIPYGRLCIVPESTICVSCANSN